MLKVAVKFKASSRVWAYTENMKKPSDSKLLAAVDVGAGGGRLITGTFEAERLHIFEAGRFPNPTLTTSDGLLRWNVRVLEAGVREALDGLSSLPVSLGVDTWGVDFALIDQDGNLLDDPLCYRNERSRAAAANLHRSLSPEKLYARTGIQFQHFNTVYQLRALSEDRPEALEKADRLLFMADYLHYRLCGSAVNEATMASTSGMLDATRRDWDPEILNAAGIPARLLQRVRQPGASLGRARLKLGEVQVILPPTHDTAAAVAAVPAVGKNFAYVCTGTWCLAGIEASTPDCSENARGFNFTNEGGVGGTYRFLKNVMGLWLVRRLKEDWELETGKGYEYPELFDLARAAPPFSTFIFADDPSFFNPPSMRLAIDEWCRATGQKPPESVGAYVRTTLEALAFRFYEVLAELEDLGHPSVDTVHLVGGGALNELLCEFTAEATGRLVMAGPIESTAVGNLLTQAVALGLVPQGSEREVVRSSFEIREYRPRNSGPWKEAKKRYRAVLAARS